MFQTLAGSCGKFAPFEIKENMVLAPLSRVALDPDDLEQLDKLLHAQNAGDSFLKDLKCRKPRKTGPTLVSDSSDSFNRSVCTRGLALLLFSETNCRGDLRIDVGEEGRLELFCGAEPPSPVFPVTWWWWITARLMLFLRGRSLVG